MPMKRRFAVLLPDNRIEEGIKFLAGLFGLQTIIRNVHESEKGDAILLSRLGILIINRGLDEPEIQALMDLLKRESSPVLAIEEDQFLSSITLPAPAAAASASFDERSTTWGLQATGVDKSSFTGKGIKLAILDTGLAFSHPDLSGRTIKSSSFAKSSPTGSFLPVEDSHGHGSHCAGIACGASTPSVKPRYGVASGAELYIGKVAEKAGGIFPMDLYRGIEWALDEGCHIISISIAFPARPTGPDAMFEAIGDRALKAGSLIIVAAGNDSGRSTSKFIPVGSPANAKTIMAVGALGSDLKVADFSNQGQVVGGEVDIAGPGVSIYSVSRVGTGSPANYIRRSGTSMATPYVAGIAALWAEKTGARGQALWDVLTQNAKNVGLDRKDVGAGLVQAP
jgi:subtilisin family serine protease